MAGRSSIFLTLLRNGRGIGRISRSFSSGAGVASHQDEESDDSAAVDDLRSRIMRLRLPKRSATNVLNRWASEGNAVAVSELRQISRELRKSNRYKHALEISEWMISQADYTLVDSDYAIRIDLMNKVFGIDAAERYFEGLPESAKTSETYTALLHSYASCKLVDRAENLFERIKEANLSLSAIPYNELMTLYTSVGQLEKIPLIVEEMERQKVVLDLFTFNLLLSSLAASLNIDELHKILDKMSDQPAFDETWLRYANLVKIYVKSCQLANSDCSLVVETEQPVTQREWITYDFLVILFGGMGNKDQLDQIWKSLISTKQKMIGRNYACVVSSYLMLGHLKEVKEILRQWKESTTTEFDGSVCSRLLSAFREVGLSEEAKALHMLLVEENILTE